MMISYKALTGVEIQHWKGNIYFWVASGVYSLSADTLHTHKNISGPRQVEFYLIDTKTGKRGHCITTFADDYDDWEIINRYVSGTGACDCCRGQMMYGENHEFLCDTTDNRFIIQKMVIRGERFSCTIIYKGYM